VGESQLARELQSTQRDARVCVNNVTDAQAKKPKDAYKKNQGASMRTIQLRLRCYAERDPDGSWFAICIDLNLYARAGSFKSAQKQLSVIISEYVREAFGQDREHFGQLMFRRAPLSFVLKYHWGLLCNRLFHRKPPKPGPDNHRCLPYDDTLPLQPA
jgi:hypothetical protein